MLEPKNVKPSEKEPKNNAPLPNKVKSSSNLTRNATTVKPSGRIDIELFDQWVDNLTSAEQEAFNGFAIDSYSVIECFLYARFLGYRGSIVPCELWVKSHYPKPDHRKTLLYEITEMQEDIRKLRADVDDGLVKRDAGVARVASMQKELRGTIAQIESYTASRDRKGLLMAGADRAIRELMAIFKDDPIEIPLEEASMSVWAKIQYEEA